MRLLPVLASSIACCCAFASAARADAFGELPYLPVTGRATCLQPTGEPGRLARADSTGVDLLSVTPDGVRSDERVALGEVLGCPSVATRPGGAAVVEAIVVHGDEGQVVVVARGPGEAFGRPTVLASMPRDTRFGASVAVSPAGDAAVALEEIEGFGFVAGRTRVLEAERRRGSAFGPVRTLMPWRTSDVDAGASSAVGVDDAGIATTGWSFTPDVGRNGQRRDQVYVAGGDPAAGGAVTKLATGGEINGPRLVVASDGAALLAFSDGERVRYSERVAGASAFTAPAAVEVGPAFANEGHLLTAPAVALSEDGSAVIAWRDGASDPTSVTVASRREPGPLGPAHVVVPARNERPGQGVLVFYSLPGWLPQLVDDPALGAALGSDGRFVLTWTDHDSPRTPLTPRAAAGVAGGDGATPVDLKGGSRDVSDIAPLIVGDAPAAAWADNAGFVFPSQVQPLNGGRVHAALAGRVQEATPAAPPRLSVAAVQVQRLDADGTATLRVRCDRPCDLRATAIRGRDEQLGETQTLARAGSTELRFRLGTLSLRLAAGRATLPVLVHATAPGGVEGVDRRVRLPLDVRPTPPAPRVIGVKTQRRGGRIEVSWRTDGPAVAVQFTVFGQTTKAVSSTVTVGQIRGLRHRSFHALLRDTRRVRYVSVITTDLGFNNHFASPVAVKR